MSLTSTLLILFLIVLYTMQSLFCRFFSMNYPGKEENTSFVFSVTTGIAVTILTFAYNGFTFQASWITLLLGLLNAVALFGYNLGLIKATEIGSYSITMISILFGGILIPLFFSVIVYQDTLNVMQLIAIAMMLVSFVFLNWDGLFGNEKKPLSAKFLLLCALLFLCNGAYGQLISTQQIMTNDTQREEMIMITYFFMAILALIVLMLKLKKGTVKAFKQNRKSGIFLACCCLIIFSALNLLVYILSLVNTAVLYTMDNGGVLLLSLVCSCIFFKEKFTAPKLVGVVLSVASIFMLSIF